MQEVMNKDNKYVHLVVKNSMCIYGLAEKNSIIRFCG